MFKADQEFKIEQFRAVSASGQSALLSAFNINGNASLALLAFCGYIATAGHAENIAMFVPSMVLFLVGTLLSAVAKGGVFFVNRRYQHADYLKTSDERLKEYASAERLNGLVVLLVVLAYVMFALGCFTAIHSLSLLRITPKAGTVMVEPSAPKDFTLPAKAASPASTSSPSATVSPTPTNSPPESSSVRSNSVPLPATNVASAPQSKELQTSNFLTWLIPKKSDVMWGSLISALAVVATLYLGNNAELKRMQIQKDFDKDAKEKERLDALRREVYFPALERFTDALLFLQHYATSPIATLGEALPMKRLAKALTRSSLIAPEAVLERTAATSQKLLETTLSLAFERSQIEQLASEIAEEEGQIERLGERVERYKTILEQREASGVPLEDLRKKLTAYLGAYQHRLGQVEVRKHSWEERRAEKVSSLQAKAIDAMVELQQLQNEALIAIRKELGIETDAAWMRAFSARNISAAMAAVKNFNPQTLTHSAQKN